MVLQLKDFDFELPEELIALRPASPRPASRLLVSSDQGLKDMVFHDIGEALRPGDLLVFNDTKVIPARLSGKRFRETKDGAGVATIEVTLAEASGDGSWLALAKPAKRLRKGDVIAFDEGFEAHVGSDPSEGVVKLEFNLEGEALEEALSRLGSLPLPPYISGKRAVDERDIVDYQTVFAREIGAVAAPTASLHFTNEVIEALSAKGIGHSFVTLHVGAGTFLPVKVESIADHKMHYEWGRVPAETALRINETRAAGGRVIPVGTTALRLIETAAPRDGYIEPWEGRTNIFITPGYHFKITDALITNFHLPKSTLIMLVTALIGFERAREVYQHAIEEKYRFFSYGDSSLLLP